MQNKYESHDKLSLEEAADLAGHLMERLNSSVFGQEEFIAEAISCFLAGGHILITGAPGLAKTSFVRVLAHNLGIDFGRVQFTPDLLPADIIGSEVLNIDPQTGKKQFEFSKGPVFTNLLLADEINRASPKTQSALLEAMQERTSTVANSMYQLPDPFMVFATQNPFESEGTFPLPEAQMDRFLIHTLVDYPNEESEERILRAHVDNNLVGENRSFENIETDRSLFNLNTVLKLIDRAKHMPLDDELLRIIKELVRSTRPEDENCPADMKESIWYGAGPRAGISLISISKAYALIARGDTVRWKHIRRMAKPVLRHRIRLTAHAHRGHLNEDKIVDELIDRLEDRHRFLAKGVV